MRIWVGWDGLGPKVSWKWLNELVCVELAGNGTPFPGYGRGKLECEFEQV